jgi:hypothetical protein
MTYKTRPWPGDQDPDELTRFLDFVVERKVRRYLEIGSRNGDSFYAVMMAIGPGGLGIAVDLHENAGSKKSLVGTIKELNDEGIKAMLQPGNSQNPNIRDFVGSWAPYDLVLIDANHTYAGVEADWAAYSHMAPIVALHDVAGPEGYMSDGRPNEVRKFWKEITREIENNDCGITPDGSGFNQIISPGSVRGFGIVIK